MSRSYKFHNHDSLFFVSFATVGWIDVFTRVRYKEIFVESLKFCQEKKGLKVYAWCLMTNHVHLIIQEGGRWGLSEILRDLKKFTSKKIIQEIIDNPQESRKEWMMAIFKNAGNFNPNNTHYQFWQQHNKPIELWSANVIDQKVDYIHQNPVEEGIVANPEDYLYSSARDFAGEKGLVTLCEL